MTSTSPNRIDDLANLKIMKSHRGAPSFAHGHRSAEAAGVGHHLNKTREHGLEVHIVELRKFCHDLVGHAHGLAPLMAGYAPLA
jgi:hypothetical protein